MRWFSNFVKNKAERKTTLRWKSCNFVLYLQQIYKLQESNNGTCAGKTIDFRQRQLARYVRVYQIAKRIIRRTDL